MSVRWLHLFLALLLLYPPLPLSPALRKMVLSPRRNASARASSMALCWQNWVDLARAGVGAFLLSQWAFQVEAGVPGAAAKALFFQALALVPAIILQMIRMGREVQLVAPVFYLCGVVLAFGGYVEGGFAVFVGWLFAIGGNRPAYQLPLMAAALVAGGYVLNSALSLPSALACGLICLPLMMTFLLQKPLAFVARERIRAPEPESAKSGDSDLNPA